MDVDLRAYVFYIYYPHLSWFFTFLINEGMQIDSGLKF